jgi:bifunctional DNA-binding transcriptional regulator/antitoxin component of YhaV-PrlF toxin-antitoxin module
MLAKITSKNQITIPKAIMEHLPAAEYFDLELKEGVIIMQPVQVAPIGLEAIRAKMNRLGLTEESISDAVRWAREHS